VDGSLRLGTRSLHNRGTLVVYSAEPNSASDGVASRARCLGRDASQAGGRPAKIESDLSPLWRRQKDRRIQEVDATIAASIAAGVW
jgi:hypothetical protein